MYKDKVAVRTKKYYRSRVYLPVKLINSANEGSWLLTLAYFVRLKALYKNCTIYDFTGRKAAELIKCSPTTLNFHIKILEELGLARRHHSNMTFIGFDKLKEWSGGGNQTAAVEVDNNNQLNLLRLPILNTSLRQQDYNRKKHGIKLREVTEGMNILPDLSNESVSSYSGCSCIRVGLMFPGKCRNGRMSKESGGRIVRKLASLGKIKVTKIFAIFISDISIIDYKHLKAINQAPAHSFYYRGAILIPKRTAITYLGT